MFNTGNPVPSTSLRDLSDNAEVFDKFMSSSVNQVVDRTGRSIYTVWFFSQLAATANAQIGATVTAAQAQVNAARDAGVTAIGVSVQAVDDAEAAAVLAMNEQVDSLSDDLGYKGFDTYAQMIEYVPRYNGVLAWVRDDPDPANIGFYQWDAATSTWIKPYPQPALSTDVDALRKDVSTQLRPRGPITGDAPLALRVAGKSVQVAAQQSMPRGPSLREGPYMLQGETPVPSSITRLRPRSQGYPAQVVVISGRSVLGEFGASTAPATPVDLSDAKLIQEQNQAPVGTRQAAIVGGQVWGYDPFNASQLTAGGTWLAANAAAFDIVRALKSGSPAQPHSITRDGRIFRDGNVLLQKLWTGQSLALGSRGGILDPNGPYVLAGKTVRLMSPYTPVGYTDKLFSLPGGPRPTSWVGATTLEPLREYFSDLLGETPATSYALAFRRWHERTNSIAPRMVCSISALGGMAYSGLKKGTTTYTEALQHITAAKNIAVANGWDHQVLSISIVHGESQVDTTQAEYVAMIAEWISDYRTDIVAITGQAVPPVGFISQMLTGENGTVPAIPLAQLQAHNENDNVILVCPKYAYQPYFDTYHMTAEGYVKTGELEARAERLTQVSGKWQPLKPVTATFSGSTITLRLNNLPNGNAATSGPIGKLAIDRVTVSDPGNAGFLISAGTITSVVLGDDGASVVITTAAPVAAGTILTYALQNLNSSQTGNGRRGCIRDTDMRDLSRYDNKFLFNWLCAFSLELQ